jgi:hypothetical protein
MTIVKIIAGYGDETQNYWVAVEGDRCVTAHRFRRNNVCDHAQKQMCDVDVYDIAVQEKLEGLPPAAVLEALTRVLQGETCNTVTVELARRPFTPQEVERFEFQRKVAEAKAKALPDPDLEYLPAWAKEGSQG